MARRHLATPTNTLMSFFSVEKYPPSLHYLLSTLGVVFLLFSLADYAVEHARAVRIRAFLDVYGRVPFFFYILHIFLLHLLALAVAASIRRAGSFGPRPMSSSLATSRTGATLYPSTPYGSASCWCSIQHAPGSANSRIAVATGGSATCKPANSFTKKGTRQSPVPFFETSNDAAIRAKSRRA